MSEAEFLKRYEALCREAFMFIESEDDGTPFIAAADDRIKRLPAQAWWAPLDDHLRRLKAGL